MSIIYEPRGKAREYSPLAANLYSGCGHKCSYCYVPNVIKMERTKFDSGANERPEVIKKLEKDAKKYFGSKQQVFMSFTTDPYNPINTKLKLTRQALEIFLENKIPVCILTKSGLAVMQDLDLFKKFGKHIKIGTTITYDNETDSKRIERGAALPDERIEMLKQLKLNNIRTWVSFEPIMQPEQTLNMLKRSIEFTDEYQFGKLSGEKRNIDWNYYVSEYVKVLRENNKLFYIKDTLRNAAKKVQLNENEIDIDYLTLPAFEL